VQVSTFILNFGEVQEFVYGMPLMSMLKPALFIILRTCSNTWNWHLVILSIRSNIKKILRSISLKVNYWIVDWSDTYLPNLVMHLISRYNTL